MGGPAQHHFSLRKLEKLSCSHECLSSHLEGLGKGTLLLKTSQLAIMRNSNCPLSGAPIADYPYEAGSSSYPSQALKLGQIL